MTVSSPHRDRLATLAATMLDRNAAPGDLWEACRNLYELLVEVTGLPPQAFDPAVVTETMLPTGRAIAPIEAAHCLFDAFRTQAFACAVVDAVAQRRRRDPSRPVHVLYAGCGPFATLLLPAFTRFSPAELQCTLIDIHQPSIDALRALVSGCDLAGFVHSIEMTDAATYRIPSGQRPDVLVIECLLRGLSSEPQVAITWNLASQAGPDVDLVPAEIRLQVAYAGDWARTAGPSCELVRVGKEPIFTLSADAVAGWGPYDPTVASLAARTVTIGRSVSPPDLLALATTIRVHGDIELGDYQSGLTRPLPLEHPASCAAGTQLSFVYRIGKPGIETTAVHPPPAP